MHVLNADKTGPRVKCPQCGEPIVWDPANPHRPFCSERCKLIDLGNWASDEYTIAGEELSPENLNEDAPE